MEDAAETFPYIEEVGFMLEIESAEAEVDKSTEGRIICRDDLGVDRSEAAGEVD